MTKKKKSEIERIELLWRILVAIVSGIILGIWRWLIGVLAVFHFIYVLFTGKRNKGIANFCEYWNTETYKFIRYLTFETNKRPFPFTEMEKWGKFER